MAERIWLDWFESTCLYQRLRLWMNRGLVEFLHKRVLTNRSNLRVAEVACGSGYAAHLISHLPEVSLSVAADINLEDYHQANMKNYGASFVLMDIFRPAAKWESMDLVWNSSSIEELDRPKEAIKSMALLAKPSGLIFVGVPNRYGIASLPGLVPSQSTRAWLGRTYNRAELRRLIEESGLVVKEMTSYFFGVFIGVLAQKSPQ